MMSGSRTATSAHAVAVAKRRHEPGFPTLARTAAKRHVGLALFPWCPAAALVPEVTSVLQQHGGFEVCAHDVQLTYSHLSAEAVLKVRIGACSRPKRGYAVESGGVGAVGCLQLGGLLTIVA
jgi:hypothetical protein